MFGGLIGAGLGYSGYELSTHLNEKDDDEAKQCKAPEEIGDKEKTPHTLPDYFEKLTGNQGQGSKTRRRGMNVGKKIFFAVMNQLKKVKNKIGRFLGGAKFGLLAKKNRKEL